MQTTTKPLYDFWSLPDEKKFEIAHLIAMDNLEVVNKDQTPIEVPDTFYTRYGKRILDVFISIIALVVTAPINLVLLIGTLIDVGTPVFFRQRRLGKGKKSFVLVKFRNMTNEKNEDGVLLAPEQRVTKWGCFVRKTSLDELLNFWYILKGDMSVIGPRPLTDEYFDRYSARHDARHLVRPGLECPLHDSNMTGMTWENRFENDVWYVEHISFKTDVKLFFLLIKEVLEGADKRGNGSNGTFMGYDENGRVIDSDHIPEKYYRMVLEGAPK